MKININNRLRTIGDFLSLKDRVLDVGCDHALLGIYLYLEKGIKSIGSDINEKPLSIAKQNLLKYHLEDIIPLRLGDGLKTMDKDINTVVISGMGGLTINHILSHIKDYDNVCKLVISPNNDFVDTRKFITKLGFKITKEVIVCENNKYYLITLYEKGISKKFNPFFGKLSFHDKKTVDYYQAIYQTNKVIIKKLNYRHLLKKWSLIWQNRQILRKLKQI